MKRLRPNQQQVANFLKVFGPFLGAVLLLVGLAAAFTVYNTAEQRPATVDKASNNHAALTEEAQSVDKLLSGRPAVDPVAETVPLSEDIQVLKQEHAKDKPEAKVRIPTREKPEQVQPVSQILFSRWASISSLIVNSVAELIQQYVRHPQSAANIKAQHTSFGQRLGTDVLSKLNLAQEAHGESLLSELNELVVPPPQMTANETLPAGTWIIAMDNALQDGSDTRVRQAYGLAVHLLNADIPLKWIIDPNKTNRTDVDFSASARRLYPTTSGFSTRNFRTGPIAIFPGFETQAQSVINSFGNGIRVYELQNATTVPVNSDLLHKPFVFVEQEQNPGIHTGILDDAGLVSGTHYTTGSLTTITASSCVTIITVPHNDDISDAQVNAVKAFTRGGGNFFAQCAGVRGFQGLENASVRLFTNAGFVDEPGLGTFLYDNPQEPSAQFEGNIADEGGSLENFAFQTDPPGGTRIVHDSDNDFKAYTGRIDGFTAGAGGYVHYLGGHDHGGEINAERYYLNAVLRSAERPSICNLDIAAVNAVDDSGVVDCDTDFIDIDVLGNDQDLTNNPPLTIQNLTNTTLGLGAFAVVGGQVRFTPNFSSTWAGPAIATYEACNNNNLCDQATITITGPNPNENQISGTVFEDTNEDGNLDGGETGPSGVQVDLYEDVNNDGMVDGGDLFISSQNTSAGGDYTFTVNTIPTSTTNATISTTKATGSYEDNDDEGYGSCDEIFIEEDSDFRGHVFIDFDLSSLPTGCTVTSANLRLVLATGHKGDNFNVQVRRVTNPWEEGNGDCDDSGSNTSGVTWLNRASGTPWGTPGGDFASTVYGTFNGGDDDPNGTVYNIDVATLVNEWLNGTPNHGLVLIPASVDQSGGDDWFYIYSDDASAADRPQLEVTVECVNNTNYVMEVNTSTLPTGATLTTDNVETASFTALGQLDCNNDFGFIACPSEPDAGTDGTAQICEGETTLQDLFSIITGEDAGGSWAQTSGPSSIIVGSGTSLDFSGASPGVYVFTYTVTAPNCPTDMSTATITVVDFNTAGAALPVLEICETSTTVIDLFSRLTGEDSGGTWTASGSNPAGGTFNAAAGTFNPTGAGVGTYSFTYSFAANGPCPADSETVEIEVAEQKTAGTALGNLQICETNTTTIDLFSRLSGEDTGGTWTVGGSNPTGGTFNAGAGTFDPTGASVGTYTFTYSFSAVGGCDADDETVTIIVNEQKEAGTPEPTLTICEGSTTVIDLFTRLMGEDSGGTWTADGGNPAGGTFNAGAGTFDPTGAGLGTYSFTYSFAAVGGCASDNATVSIEISEQFSAGTALAALEICETSTAVVDLFSRLTGEDSGGMWTAGGSNPAGGTFNAGAGTFDPTGAGIGTYTFTYSFAAANGCVADDETVEIIVAEQKEAGTPEPALEICETSTTVIDLFSRLIGEDSGGTWTAGSNPAGGTFSAGAGTFDPAGAGVGTYTFTYSFAAANGCSADDATIEIVVAKQNTAGTALAALEICETNTTTIDLFNRLTGEDSGGTWTAGSNPAGGTFNAGAGTFNPTGASVGTYTFTYSFAAVGGCDADDETVTIIVNEQLLAGADNSAEFCEGSGANFSLTGLLSGADAGGDWAQTGGTTTLNITNPSNVDFSSAVPDTYIFTYTHPAVGSCSEDQAVMTITVTEQLMAGADNDAEFCEGSGANFNLAGLLMGADAGGDWAQTGGVSFIGLGDPTDVDFSNATPAVYTFTYTHDATGSCVADQAIITVTVTEQLEAGADNSDAFCEGEEPDYDLTNLLSVNADAGGNWAQTGGVSFIGLGDPTDIDFSNASPAVYTFTYTHPIDGSCLQDQATFTITIEERLDPGTNGTLNICAGETVTEMALFASLGGTPDMGGAWTPQPLGGAGTYTYTHAATANCPASTAQVVVSETTGLDAGENGTLVICAGDVVTEMQLFDALEGTPDAGGVWTPQPLGGAGMYTYTHPAVGACPETSAVVTVTEETPADAGMDGTTEFCEGETTLQNLNNIISGEDTGGSWSETTMGASSGVTVGDGTAIDFSNAAPGVYEFTYTIAATAACPAVSSKATVTVTDQLLAGADNSAEFCEGSGASFNLTNLLSGEDAGGDWAQTGGDLVNISDPTSVDFSNEVPGTYTFTYTHDPSGSCPQDQAVFTITITDQLLAGADGSDEFCEGEGENYNLNTLLSGADAGGDWAQASGAMIDVSNPTDVDFNTAAPGTYIFTYTHDATGSCLQDQATFTITIEDRLDPGTNGTLTICAGETVTEMQLFMALGGTPDMGGVWTPQPLAGAGTYTYTHAATANCSASSAQVVVTETTGLDPGTNGSLAICAGETVTEMQLFDALGGTPDAGGVWTPQPLAGAGTYTYTHAAVGACPESSAEVMVTENANPNAGLAVTDDVICVGETGTITVNGTENGVSYQLRLESDDSNVGPAQAGNGGTLSFNVTPGSTTMYNILATNTTTNCAVELNNKPTVTVNPLPVGNLDVSDDVICVGETAMITVSNSESGVLYQLRDDANDNAVGSALIGNGGDITFTLTPTSTTTYNVLAVITATNCSVELSDKATVTVNANPNANLVVSDPTVCVGATGLITILNSEVDVSYQLRLDDGSDTPVGSPVVGNGGTISISVTPGGTTTYNILATNLNTACFAELAAKPTVTVESCAPGAQDDFVLIDCGTSTIVINVLANDAPFTSGGTLLVQSVGAGSQGTFVNNNDGTVTYTPNNSELWVGPEIVTYEVCEGSECSEASIIITSFEPNNNVISGTVFLDDNENSLLEGSEMGEAGIEVDLYVDENMDGQVDGGDTFVGSESTGPGGEYNFIVSPPTMTTNESLVSIKSAEAYRDEPNRNFGNCFFVNIEEDDDPAFSFFEFDLSAFQGCSSVTSATLSLVQYDYDDEQGADFTFGVRRVLSPWTEGTGGCEESSNLNSGLTWNRRDGVNSWNTLGGDFASTIYDTEVGGAGDPEGTVYTFDITVLVNEWLSGTYPNYGLAIVPINLSPGEVENNFTFFTEEATDPAVRPRLDFEVTCGNPVSYVLEVDMTTLPIGASLTTDNIETATFSTAGKLDCNNDFGYISCPDQPDISITTGPQVVCLGDDATLSATVNGGAGTCSIQWQQSTSGTGGWTNVGTNSTTLSPNTTLVGTLYYRAIYSCTGADCGDAISNISEVTVNPNPADDLTVSDDAICAGDMATITISGSEPGVSYQLRLDADNSNVGAPVAGNGSDISFSVTPGSTTTYNILATNSTTSCFAELTDKPTVTVNPNPNDALAVSDDVICSGETATITISGSENGVSYQLRLESDDSNVGTPVAGNGGTISINVMPGSTTAYNILATNTTTNCFAELTDKPTVTVNANPNAGLAVTDDVICEGETGTITVNASESGVSYQLRLESDDSNVGAPVAGNGGAINFNVTPATTTMYNILATNTTTNCAIELNNKPTVTVNPIPQGNLDVSDDEICEGETAMITISNSQSGILYQLRDDSNDNGVGSALIGNGGDLTFNLSPGTTTTYNVLAVITATNCSVELTDKSTVTVNPNPADDLTVSDDAICAGDMATITISGSEPGVSYQLRLDADDSNVGAPVAGNGSDISFSVTPGSTTTYNILATNSTTSCFAELTDKPAVTVEDPLDPGTNGTLNICAGETVTEMALFASLGGTPDMGGVWTPQPLAGAGTYTYTHAATANCPATSAQVVVSETTGLDAGENGTLEICAGETVTEMQLFDALGGTPDAGGVWTPQPLAGAGTYTYTHAAVGACPASSAQVTVIENANPNAGLAVTDDVICEGETGTITVNGTENGVSYQLRLESDDSNVGPAQAGNGGTISFNVMPGSTTMYNILATNTTTNCAIELNSKPTVTVNPLPSAMLVVSDDVICAGETAMITISNSESGVLYQLRNDANDNGVGSALIGNGGDLTFNLSPSATTTYNVLAVITATNCSVELTDKATVTVSAFPDGGLAVSDGGVCTGDPITITVSNSENGVNYQLRLDSDNSNVGSPVAGTGGSIFFIVSPTVTTTYNVLATTDGTDCAVELLDKPTITVVELPEDGLAVSDDEVCIGETAMITISNSQPGVSYQLRLDIDNSNVGSPVIGNGGDVTISINVGMTTTFNIFNVLATDISTTCESELLDKPTVAVNDLPADDLEVSDDVICAGDMATITIAGSEPGVSYQLRLDADDSNVGAPVAGNGGTISINVMPGSTTTYNILATNTTTNCFAELTDKPIVTVEDPLDPGTNGTLNICAGETVTEMALFASLGGTPDMGGVWTPQPLAGAGTYTYTHAATANCPATSAQVVVSETTGLDAGENGTLEICAGEIVTEMQLFDALGGTPDAGGVWTPQPLAGAGTYTYTHAAVGACPASSAQVTVIENANPNAGLATTDDVICEGETGTITVNGTENGVSYQLRLESDDSNVGPAQAGNGGTISFNVTPGSTTMYNILATNTTTNCAIELNSKPTVTVNPLPSAMLVVSDDVICAGETAMITISNSESGVLYQLRNDANDNGVGSALIGNGGDLTFNLSPSATTTYNVLAVITATNCSVELTDKATVTVNPNPADDLTVSDDAICAGDMATITISGSEPGVSYQLRLDADDSNVGAPVAGNGSDISFSVTPGSTTAYNILATNSTTSCFAELTDKPAVTVEDPLDPGANGTLSICAGETVTEAQLFAALGGTPDMGGVWSPMPFGGEGTYTYTHAATTNCPESSAEVVVTGTTGLDAGENGTLEICAGETVTETQLFNALGGTPDMGGEWTPMPFGGAGTYTYTHAAVGACAETSAEVVVTENPNPNTGLAVTDDAICEDGTATITISASESGVSYQLRLDADDSNVGTPIAGTGGAISFSVSASSTTVYNVLATNSTTACSAELIDKPTVTTVICNTFAVNDINQTPVNVPVSGNVLTNDFDRQGDMQTVISALADIDGDGVVGENLPLGMSTTLYGTDDNGNTVTAGTLILFSNGGYDFTPAMDFTGDVPFRYTITDDNPDGFSTDDATVAIEVIGESDPDDNEPPVANDDTQITEQDTDVSGNVLDNDSDPDGDPITVVSALADTNGDGLVDDVLPVGTPTTVFGTDQAGSVVTAGVLTLNTNGVYSFDPEPPFLGEVPSAYTIGDPDGLTDDATLTILVEGDLGNETYANDDANAGPQDVDQVGNVLDNDSDPENDLQIVVGATDSNGGTVTAGTPATLPSGGTLTLNANGSYLYEPAAGFVGTEAVIYSIEDNGSPVVATDMATLYLTTLPLGCVEIEAWVYLEGAAIDPSGALSYSFPMRTDLNDLRLLPGQVLVDPFLGNKYNPAQPYSDAPWSYFGMESALYDSGGDANQADANYPVTVVDWVLVSLRETPGATGSPLCETAALLHADGRIELVSGFECCTLDASQSYYLVVEHRNHLIVMSHAPVPIVDGKLTYDFRNQQSYIEDPFGFGSFAGQKEVSPDVFVMYGGNGDQTTSGVSDTDINSDDRARFELDNSELGEYRIGDFNLSGDTNFADRLIFEQNNGTFTSVPRD